MTDKFAGLGSPCSHVNAAWNFVFPHPVRGGVVEKCIWQVFPGGGVDFAVIPPSGAGGRRTGKRKGAAMAIYKGIEIDDSLAGIIRYMQGVEDYREVLGKLQGAWDILTLLGQLTGAAAEMSGTREAFQQLTGTLLNHLGKETRRKAVADLRAKAQIGIDILVRNLFERTADIGFLSADDDIRDFLLAEQADPAPLEARFHEYVAKYSVYSDIVLFAGDGRVRARLAPHGCERSKHGLLDAARDTAASYVEFFGTADFLPPGSHLVYAYRVEDRAGACLGVLALVFRLEDEMQGIYANLLGAPGDCSLLATVSGDGVVVATSSPIQLPPGTRLPEVLTGARGDIVRFAGREYLAVACRAHGYQGYDGPGWLGLGLLPVEFAFERNETALLAHLDAAVLAAVTAHPTLFSEELRRIPLQAERIQEELNRSVWNGSVRQVDSSGNNAAFAKTLLWEISSTGRKTQAVFEQSIGNLHQTVVAALLQSGVARAAFAIDVMDRNLYERANDCRWWALNATFRRVLAGLAGAMDGEIDGAARCADILAYINGLYTVYDNLILFDARGGVIAVSRPEAGVQPGMRLQEEWVGRCLALDSSQGYVVSSFAPTALYGGRHTYIYAAAVQHPHEARTVGGIGIVFDSAPQFSAMLSDTLPREPSGQPQAGTFALFTDRRGRVLATTDARYPVGGSFPLAAEQTALGHGGRCANVLVLDEQYYAVGTTAAAGYREYKRSDGHVDEVLAICAYPLGAVAESARVLPRRAGLAESRSRRAGGAAIEIATFHVGNQWLGLPAASVVEAIDAIDASGLTPAIGGSSELVAGLKMFRGKLISVLHLARLLQPEAPVEVSERQIIVVRTHDKICMGLLVDELGEIPEVSPEEIQPVGNVAATPGVLSVGVVNSLRPAEDRFGLLSILDADRLCLKMGCRCQGEQSYVDTLPLLAP